MPEIGGTCLAFSSHLFSPVGTLPIDGEGRCCFQLFELLCVMPRSSWYALVLEEKILGGKKKMWMQSLGFAWLLFVTLVLKQELPSALLIDLAVCLVFLCLR